MPNRDFTGPRGMGPMTGWGMGYCAQPIPPNLNPQVNPNIPPVPPMPFYPCGRGRGLPPCGGGRGFGRGFGWRR